MEFCSKPKGFEVLLRITVGLRDSMCQLNNQFLNILIFLYVALNTKQRTGELK